MLDSSLPREKSESTPTPLGIAQSKISQSCLIWVRSGDQDYLAKSVLCHIAGMGSAIVLLEVEIVSHRLKDWQDMRLKDFIHIVNVP